jgi:hypothetical protein
MTELIVLGLVVVPLSVWALVSPRTLLAWLPRTPDTKEPGTTAYVLARLVSVVPLAALIATAILVVDANRAGEQRVGYATLATWWPLPIAGYSRDGDRGLAVVVRTDSDQRCGAEVRVVAEYRTELEIEAMLAPSAKA